MCNIHRRRLVRCMAAGLTLTPLAAALSACGKPSWPEGMAEIRWDRDTCARCNMVISDRRFAAEVRGGPRDQVFKFDDIGCVVFWLQQQPWAPDARIWVADAASRLDNLAWLDARKAHYMSGKSSPMGYNQSAYSLPQAGAATYAEMAEHILAKGK